MDKPGGLFRGLGEEKSGVDANFFKEGQWLDPENDNVGEEEDAEDVELEEIEVATWEKKNRLWVVLQEHRLQVLHHHHDSQMVGH